MLAKQTMTVGGKVLKFDLAFAPDTIDKYTQLIKDGQWELEPPALAALDLLNDGDHFVDLGACLGTFSIPVMLATGAAATLVEALPSNSRILIESLTANGLDSRARVINKAITAEGGTVKMINDNAFGTVVDDSTADTIELPALTLEDLATELKDVTTPSLIKMDIEGCEHSVMRTFKDYSDVHGFPIVIFEANLAHCLRVNETHSALLKLFADLDYNLFMIKRNIVLERSWDSFQEFGLADYVAVPKNDTERLAILRSKATPELPFRQRLKAVEFTLTQMLPGYKNYMRWQLDNLDNEYRDYIDSDQR